MIFIIRKTCSHSAYLCSHSDYPMLPSSDHPFVPQCSVLPGAGGDCECAARTSGFETMREGVTPSEKDRGACALAIGGENAVHVTEALSPKPRPCRGLDGACQPRYADEQFKESSAGSDSCPQIPCPPVGHHSYRLTQRICWYIHDYRAALQLVLPNMVHSSGARNLSSSLWSHSETTRARARARGVRNEPRARNGHAGPTLHLIRRAPGQVAPALLAYDSPSWDSTAPPRRRRSGRGWPRRWSG